MQRIRITVHVRSGGRVRFCEGCSSSVGGRMLFQLEHSGHDVRSMTQFEGMCMYGLVNKAVRGLVTQVAGEDAWARIRQDAGVEDDDFISLEAYDDDVTYRLVAAASRRQQCHADRGGSGGCPVTSRTNSRR